MSNLGRGSYFDDQLVMWASRQTPLMSDLLNDNALNWLTQAIFDEQSARRAAGESNPTAITLPDWAVEQLTELLGASEEDMPDGTPG